MEINAYAAHAAQKPLEKFRYDPPPLGPWEVEVAVTHCGICHSDVHLIDNDWGVSQYPLVPGHEIVGTVKSVGDHVHVLKKGQRVGIGWQCGACFECSSCTAGDENLCSNSQATCIGHHGGFADRVRTDSRFAFPIPKELPSESAAPLLCGGITVYSPLRYYNVTPPMHVGVLGIGGLGHFALQFARAFGCEVTAISSTPAKKEEALSLGAHHFVEAKPAALKKIQGSIDFLISTVYADLDWMAYLQLLRPKGRLCVVGVSSSPISVPGFALIGGQKSICGSVIGSPSRIQEMLEFSARHNIRAQTETAPLQDVNKALKRVAQGKARYRLVLKV